MLYDICLFLWSNRLTNMQQLWQQARDNLHRQVLIWWVYLLGFKSFCILILDLLFYLNLNVYAMLMFTFSQLVSSYRIFYHHWFSLCTLFLLVLVLSTVMWLSIWLFLYHERSCNKRIFLCCSDASWKFRVILKCLRSWSTALINLSPEHPKKPKSLVLYHLENNPLWRA